MDYIIRRVEVKIKVESAQNLREFKLEKWNSKEL